MVIQQQDYDIIQQRIINRYLKVNLLDFDYTVVDEISGNVIAFDISVDAESDIRRTCNVDIVVTDSSFDIKAGSKIWLDKMIQPYIGIENIYTGKIQWYNQGIFLINEPSWAYNATTNTLSFSAVDLMAKLTGLRNGALTGIPYVIPQGSNVRDAIITCIGLAGFTKYVVEECKRRDGVVQPVPYEIKIEQGGTIYDILSALKDIMPQYQMYFDVDGVFHYEYIPTGEDAPVMLDDSTLKKIVQSETINTSFESVKNYIEVWGNSHDVSNYPSEISIDGGATVIELPDGYTQLGYIQSSGTQYINTGFIPSNTTRVTCDVEAAPTASATWFFGARNGNVDRTYGLLSFENKYRSDFAFSTDYYSTVTPTGRFTADKNQNVTSFNDVVGVTATYARFQSSYNLYLFANNNAGTAAGFGSFKLYSCKIYDNDNLVRDFVPCKNPSGIVGLFDIVNSVFYANSGTGTFIAGSEISGSDITITLKIADLPELPEYTMIGFTPDSNLIGENIFIKVVSNDSSGNTVTHDPLKLVDSSGNVIKELDKDVYYVARIQGDTTKSWLFVGHQQAQAVWQDNNPDSPFYTGGSVGIIREVLCGGDYDNISSDELALERAKLEIYWKCRLSDTISLGMLPIPWLDVNTVIEYGVKGKTVPDRYMVKSFSANYGDIGGMDVNAMTLYPYYPPY